MLGVIKLIFKVICLKEFWKVLVYWCDIFEILDRGCFFIKKVLNRIIIKNFLVYFINIGCGFKIICVYLSYYFKYIIIFKYFCLIFKLFWG